MGTLVKVGLSLLSLFGFALFVNSSIVLIDGNFVRVDDFTGESHWDVRHLYQCLWPINDYYKRSDLGCYTYLIKEKFETIKMELLSRDPVLVVFRKLVEEGEIENFLGDVKEVELKEQEVRQEKDGSTKISLARRANGSWIPHEKSPGLATVYQKVRRVLPNVNFKSAEDWSVLSYNPGGHYAVHYDMFPHKNDSYMMERGNRWATFLVVLKTADVGGGTVFPDINVTVIPEAGDAMFWMNMNADGTRNLNSRHGACPIKEGHKIAATLWIREKNQPVLDEVQGKGLFDPNYFL